MRKSSYFHFYLPFFLTFPFSLALFCQPVKVKKASLKPSFKKSMERKEDYPKRLLKFSLGSLSLPYSFPPPMMTALSSSPTWPSSPPREKVLTFFLLLSL